MENKEEYNKFLKDFNFLKEKALELAKKIIKEDYCTFYNDEINFSENCFSVNYDKSVAGHCYESGAINIPVELLFSENQDELISLKFELIRLNKNLNKEENILKEKEFYLNKDRDILRESAILRKEQFIKNTEAVINSLKKEIEIQQDKLIYLDAEYLIPVSWNY